VRVIGWLVCAIAYIAHDGVSSYTPACPCVRQRTDRCLLLTHIAWVDAVIRPVSFLPGRSRKIQEITMSKFTTISVLVAAVALTAFAGCASTQKHESTGQYIDDSAITTSVKAAIFNEPGLKSAEINVETFKGRVQLSGFVSSRSNADRAVQVAQAVNGVTSVANDMRIK
jgi:hypothetical protein